MSQKRELNVDLCIIGAGSAGLSVAYGAAHLGRSVVLFEGAEMGGDCLNHGCVPSKAILKAGKIAHSRTKGAAFGIKPVEPEVDWERVKEHIQEVIATIAPVDSVERYEGFGTTVISEFARFTDANTVESDTTRVTAKRFIVAAGSRASAPPIPGLDTVDYATNENIFSLPSTRPPKRKKSARTAKASSLSSKTAPSSPARICSSRQGVSRTRTSSG
jgi:pyruvate/2-oxoglutarate dehydrogenase complex dihydrolipoamide dehydrogenase (E3) component